MNEGITTVFDAQDIVTVQCEYGEYEHKDIRRKKEYWSQFKVTARAIFDDKLGRDEADFRIGLVAALEHFKAQLIRELEGPFAVLPFYDFSSGLHKTWGEYRKGYWVGVAIRQTATRPKGIMSEIEWRQLLNEDLLREVMFDAARVGAETMVGRIADDIEEQLIVRMAKGAREWVDDRAKEECRYSQRIAALKAELRAERALQTKALAEELRGKDGPFVEAQKVWRQLSPAGRALVLESIESKGEIHYTNGGMGLTTHLSSPLKKRLEELRQEGAH